MSYVPNTTDTTDQTMTTTGVNQPMNQLPATSSGQGAGASGVAGSPQGSAAIPSTTQAPPVQNLGDYLAANAPQAAQMGQTIASNLTNTQSAFGEQYDSLADMVSFGVAPALVAYEWVLKDLGKWGWLAAFTYCAGAALRLARFNVNTTVVDKKFFQGLPSPAAGALLAGFIWLADDNKIPVTTLAIPWVTFFITVYAGLTMVSNARFYSGKALDVRYRVPFGVMVLMILTFVLISSNPPLALFGLFVVYSISGYVIWAWERYSGRRFG